MVTPTKTNLVLIGMPGAGKSTVGIILAKLTSCAFVDTDVLIQTSQGRGLQAIVDSDGHVVLRQIEEEILLGLTVDHHVIATGGSVAYSERGMHHLQSQGMIIFLDVDLETLKHRIHDYATRGLAKRPEQSFADLYEERYPLYTRYADITIKAAGLTQEAVCQQIKDILSA